MNTVIEEEVQSETGNAGPQVPAYYEYNNHTNIDKGLLMKDNIFFDFDEL